MKCERRNTTTTTGTSCVIGLNDGDKKPARCTKTNEMIRRRRVRQGLRNGVRSWACSRISTHTGRVGGFIEQTVKDTVFNLLFRMQAVVLILISTCFLGMDRIPSINFLAHNTGLKLSQWEGSLAGNLLQAFSCVHRISPIMEMNSCFAEIPVLIDSTVQFIDLETLVLKVHGVQEPCNE